MPDDRPNVVFVLSDQHRPDALGCAGNDEIQTPRFDRFSEQGSRLANAYANHPVCGPSRGCLISGQYPRTNGVVTNDMPMSLDATNVAKEFSEAGYRTGYIGKWHLDGVPRGRFTPPERRHGFDDFWAVYNCAHDYFNGKYYDGDGELHEIDGYEPVAQTDLALEFIESDADEPFCLFLSWGPPHDPYELVPDRYRERYDLSDVSLPRNAEPLLPGASDHPAAANLDGPPVREWGPTTSTEFETGEPYDYDDRREIIRDYYAAVTALDDQFGRVVDALDERGLADETILTYTSDHGDMLWSHGINQKGYPYEEAAGVPFLIRWPDEIPAGEVNESLLSLVDVAPTLLKLAGLDAPAAMEGVDCSSALRDPSVDGQESVFLMGSRWRGLRTEQYTYARVNDDWEEYAHVTDGHWLLFDNEADAHQLDNRVLNEDYVAVRDQLSALLDDWLDRVDDPFERPTEAVRSLGLVEEYNDQQRYHRQTKTGDVDDRYPLIEE